MTLPQGPDQRWSLDFVSDVLADGRRFRVLVVVDDFTRESLALVVDTSISGRQVARELDAIIARRKKPPMIVSDDGSELTSHAMLCWQEDRRVSGHYIAPGKPALVATAASARRCASANSSRPTSCNPPARRADYRRQTNSLCIRSLLVNRLRYSFPTGRCRINRVGGRLARIN